MRKFLIFVLSAVALYASAQGRYCKNYDDFVAGQWTELPTLNVIGHSVSHQVWAGGNDYKFDTDDKTTNKILKKEALLVEYQDTLYVNLRNLRYKKALFGNGYAQGLVYDKDKILFVTHRIGSAVDGKRFASTFFLGFVGAAISETSIRNDRVCYLIDNNGDGKKTQIVLLDDQFMNELLSKNSRLMERYKEKKKQKERESAANVLPILKELGLVE
jgi:hypothetical protein